MKRILSGRKKFDNKEPIILRDYLAMERTRLANERTLLSYLRSALYLLVGGIAVLQIQGFESIKFIGYLALALAAGSVVLGIVRFLRLNRKLASFYKQIERTPDGDAA